MAAGQKKLTFAITPDVALILDEAKRMFYDRTKSDVVRALIAAGLDTIREEPEDEREAGGGKAPPGA